VETVSLEADPFTLRIRTEHYGKIHAGKPEGEQFGKARRPIPEREKNGRRSRKRAGLSTHFYSGESFEGRAKKKKGEGEKISHSRDESEGGRSALGRKNGSSRAKGER